jgi:L-alanine-DL-glutamate epimerase-like enolase superfamily enzyme
MDRIQNKPYSSVQHTPSSESFKVIIMFWKNDELESAREKLRRNQDRGSVDKTSKIEKACWNLRAKQNILNVHKALKFIRSV